jgi:hypothetical protein
VESQPHCQQLALPTSCTADGCDLFCRPVYSLVRRYLDDPSAIQTDADIPDIYQPPANADELLAAAAAGVDPDPDLAEFQEVTVEDGHVESQLPDEGGEVLPETPAEQGPDSSNKKGNSSGGGGGLVDKLRELKELFEAEFLTAEEFAQAKAAILARASAGPKQAK